MKTKSNKQGTGRDVTEVFAGYREAVRHLWNTLVAGSDLATFDTVDKFTTIENLLFDTVVVPRLSTRLGFVPTGGWRECLRIVPSAKAGIPIMIENPRQGDKNQYWDHPIKSVRPHEVKLKFINYFDWWILGIRDCQYYLVEILQYKDHEDLQGRRALVEVGNAMVICEEK